MNDGNIHNMNIYNVLKFLWINKKCNRSCARIKGIYPKCVNIFGHSVFHPAPCCVSIQFVVAFNSSEEMKKNIRFLWAFFVVVE